MAVEAVGEVVLRKLTDLLINDSIAFDSVIDQIEHIRIQLRKMRGYLVDAERRNDPEAVAWAIAYLGVLFLAEDKIENYVLSLAARGSRNIGFFQRRGLTLFNAAVHDCFGPGRMLRRWIRDLTKEMEHLETGRPREVLDASLQGRSPSSNQLEPEEGIPTALASGIRSFSDHTHSDVPGILCLPDNRNIVLPGSPRSSPHGHRRPAMLTTAPPEGPTLIGFTDIHEQLKKRLKERQGGVIPVVGSAGSGKTTLVQTVYDLREIKAHFDCRAWVRVADDFITISQLVPNLLQQVLKSKEGGNPSVDQLISRVQDSLREKTYLIVLDHVFDVQIWNEVKSAFPNLESGASKVILITRDDAVANSVSAQEGSSPSHLKELCLEHRLELFTKKSCLAKDCKHLDVSILRDIVSGKGRPLDIVLLGGLLSTKGQSCKEWNWYLSQASWSGIDALSFSYNDLPAYSKLCLLYMTLFPNEMDISVRRIHRLWLAEGFVKGLPGMSEEDSVEACFDDLVQRNFIKVSKLRSDGSPRRCCLPRALREYLSPKAQLVNLFKIHRESSSTRGLSAEGRELVSKLPVRRIIEYVDIKNYNPAVSATGGYENLKSYLSFNLQRNDTPAKEVGNFISKIIGKRRFGALRVLDLENVYKPTLPDTLKQLFHLRYLGLRWTFIDNLPKSVGDLTYLETLDLKQTYINSLPSSIRKLKHLRHLNLPGIRLDYNKKKHHSSLTELRTLVGLIVDDETSVTDELIQLCELRELDITCQSSVSKELMCWIQKLTKLRFLWLKSKNSMGRPSGITLEPLYMLHDLSHLSLLGNIVSTDVFGRGLPTPKQFPPNLKVLALSVSRLKHDPMAILSQLPHLSVLRLLADSYLGTEMRCPRNGFKSLRVLKLWMLRELVDWTVEQDGMPQLRELNIRQCTKLNQVPSRLLDQKTLEELTLTTMPEEFVQQVEEKKRFHTLLIKNNYNFTLLPWEKDPELWKSLEVDDNKDDAANCAPEHGN